jgi:hypothetical protein
MVNSEIISHLLTSIHTRITNVSLGWFLTAFYLTVPGHWSFPYSCFDAGYSMLCFTACICDINSALIRLLKDSFILNAWMLSFYIVFYLNILSLQIFSRAWLIFIVSYHGTQVPRHFCSLLLYHGTCYFCYHSRRAGRKNTVVPLYHVTVVKWYDTMYHGIFMPYFSTIAAKCHGRKVGHENTMLHGIIPLYNGTMVQRYHGILAPCSSTMVAKIPWYKSKARKYHGTDLYHGTCVPW